MLTQAINKMTTEAVDFELARAERKFEAWQNISPLERLETLIRVETLVRSKRDRLAGLYITELKRFLS